MSHDDIEETTPNCKPTEHSKVPHSSEVERTEVLQSVERLFRALGDVPRLQLLLLIARREWCVSELVETLGEKFSTVSQRLRLLHTERLVNRRREGTHIYYSLADSHVVELLNNAIEHAKEQHGGSTKEKQSQEPNKPKPKNPKGEKS